MKNLKQADLRLITGGTGIGDYLWDLFFGSDEDEVYPPEGCIGNH